MGHVKKITSGFLIAGITLSSLVLPQGRIQAKSSDKSAKSGKIVTKRYTISKKAGTYAKALWIKLKAKKGYKVYYTTSGKFRKKAVANSGKSVRIRLKKSTKLRVYAVKKSARLSARKMNGSSRKRYKYYKTYKYIIRKTDESKTKSTVAPSQAADGGVSTGGMESSAAPQDTAETATQNPEGTISPENSGEPDGQGPEGAPPDGTPPAGGGASPDGTPPAGGGGFPGDAGEDINYSAVKEYTSDTEVSGENISSTGTDENAVLISNGANVTLTGSTVSRVSSDSVGGDAASFYGVGAAVLAKEGTVYLKDSTISTDAAGAAGIFAYGSGTAYAANTKITTKKDTAGGIHVAGGGSMYAWDLDVETFGQSSAAIRSDRGGGKMVMEGGSYTSHGTGSPAIYSTADIAVADAVLTANASEAICIEGLNAIHLFDTDLTGNMGDDSQNDCTWNVILYQSMSGDSQVGNSTFEMSGGTLTAKNGGMFYTTNTESTITLTDVDIAYAEDSEFFLRCTGNNNARGWGTTGQNGADCLFTADSQTMQGDIVWDSISDLDFYMKNGSSLCGCVIDDESCAGSGGSGYCNMYIEEGCTWTVTGDSALTKLYCAGKIQDSSGKTVTVKGTDGTIYAEGESSCVVTVKEYEESVDMTGASQVSQWLDYKTEKPSAIQ